MYVYFSLENNSGENRFFVMVIEIREELENLWDRYMRDNVKVVIDYRLLILE